jgi:hypothetical protein
MVHLRWSIHDDAQIVTIDVKTSAGVGTVLQTFFAERKYAELILLGNHNSELLPKVERWKQLPMNKRLSGFLLMSVCRDSMDLYHFGSSHLDKNGRETA